jgi:nucleoside phosphorylase
LFGSTSLGSSGLKAAERAQGTKVLLVTALPKEAAAVRATFDSDEALGIRGDDNVYRLGGYGMGADTKTVILATAGVGKANAAAVTANALRSFPEIKHVIMVGIAGGCPHAGKPDEHVRLGDVVFSGSAGVIEYDYIKETMAARQIRSSLQRPSAALLQIANSLTAGDLLATRPWETIISAAAIRLGDKFDRPAADTDVLHTGELAVVHPTDKDRRPDAPRIHSGAIGTADTLLKSGVKRDELRDRFGVRAVEMEASGLQTAAWSHGKDVFVVRGICDYCDEHKNDIWQNYAALVAAAYARAIVEAMPAEWF